MESVVAPLKELVCGMLASLEALTEASVRPVDCFGESDALETNRRLFVQCGEEIYHTTTKFAALLSVSYRENQREGYDSIVREYVAAVGTCGATFYLLLDVKLVVPFFRELKGLFEGLLRSIDLLCVAVAEGNKKGIHRATGLVWNHCDLFKKLPQSNQQAYKKQFMQNASSIKHIEDEFEEYLASSSGGKSEEEEDPLREEFMDDILDFDIEYEEGPEKELAANTVGFLAWMRKALFPSLALSLMKTAQTFLSSGKDSEEEEQDEGKEGVEVDVEGAWETILFLGSTSEALARQAEEVGSELYPTIQGTKLQLAAHRLMDTAQTFLERAKAEGMMQEEAAESSLALLTEKRVEFDGLLETHKQEQGQA